MEHIAYITVPHDQVIIYTTIVYEHRPLKKEINRCFLVVGGDCLMYNHEIAAPTVNLANIKIMLNSLVQKMRKVSQLT